MNISVPASPFIADTAIQYAYDSTSLNYLKTCARLYQYIMIDGWQDRDESIHLRFGIEYHTAQQQYDIHRAKGDGHEIALRKVVRSLLTRTFGWAPDETTKAGKYKNRRSLLRTVINSLDRFNKFAVDPCTTHIRADGRPAVELSFKFELDWGPIGSNMPYMLCGHMDRVVRFQDELFVLDHKTSTTTLSDYFFNQFQPNNQMTLYTLAGQVVLGAPIKGVIIQGAQVLIDSNEFQRAFTQRTQAQLDEWVKDLHYWFALAEGYAKANYWPMNDTACDKYGGCRFRQICSKDPRVREQYLKAKFDQLPVEERWNPLKPR